MMPLEQELIDKICPAIQSRSLIRFWYENGRRKEFRIVEPYVIGSFPRKNIMLSAWALPTPEQKLSGLSEGWRSYTLKAISEVQVLEENYSRLREGFDPKGNGMDKIYCSPMRIS